MRANVIIAGGLLLFGALVIASLRPVRLQTAKDSVIEHGVIADVYKSGITDVVVKLKGQAKRYYISDILDENNISQLREKLLNKKVVIEYPDQWTPLDPDKAGHYISKLEYDGEVIYADEEKP